MADPQAAADVRTYIHEWIEDRLIVIVQERYASARRAFAAWCHEYGVDYAAPIGDDIDTFVARFMLHVKEDKDSALTRQSCLDLLATTQRRAGTRLRLSQHMLRLWHREAPPRQTEAMPLLRCICACHGVGQGARAP